LGELNDYEQTDAEHRKIVKALKDKKPALAEQTLRKHFARGEALVLEKE
jgi:DNA-binding GntR family transcriptional regulator